MSDRTPIKAIGETSLTTEGRLPRITDSVCGVTEKPAPRGLVDRVPRGRRRSRAILGLAIGYLF